MREIPVQALPNQTFQVSLGNQAAALNIYQTAYGLFVDVLVGNTTIIAGVLAQDRNRIVRSAYLGFVGDLAFFDTQGTDDPLFSGLGTRWRLIYLEAADVAAIGA